MRIQDLKKGDIVQYWRYVNCDEGDLFDGVIEQHCGESGLCLVRDLHSGRTTLTNWIHFVNKDGNLEKVTKQ